MYELVFDDDAVRFLQKLEKNIKKRILNKIENIVENPLHFLKPLEGRRDFKLRVGDYRVLADIDISNKRIEITKIGHRKNIYEQ